MSTASAFDVLLVEDDEDLRDAIATGLRLADFTVAEAANGSDALKLLHLAKISAVVSDIRMPLLDGRQLLHQLAMIDAELPVILMTGHGDIDQAVDAIRKGAYDFLAKPFAVERLADTVRRAIDKRLLVMENRALRERLDSGHGDGLLPLVGTSPAISALIRAIHQIGTADVDVLIEGEHGTGKAAVASMLHRAAARSARSIDFLDCAFSPASAIEQALRTAWPSDGRGRSGRPGPPTAVAERKTLVLDHVERLSDAMQQHLLHVIDARNRLGFDLASSCDGARILFTSAESIAGLVESGRFRADLYHRLASIKLQVPPLRARRKDLPVLFAQLVRRAAERFKRDEPALSDAVLGHLARHDWPGNLPELQNYAERVVLKVLDSGHQATSTGKSLAACVADFEAGMIRQAIIKEAGNIQKACARLSVPRKTLYDKIKKHGISLDEARKP